MKLYVIKISPTCRKVMTVAHHLGLDIDFEVLQPFSGATSTLEFLALNPHGKVPVLKQNDFILAESCAIMRYLASQVPGTTLVPADPQEVAIMDSWMYWESAHFTQALAGYFLQSFVFPHYNIAEPDEEAMASALERIYSLAGALETRLDGRDFIMGDQVTLADYAIGGISEHQRRGNQPWDGFPRIAEYFDRLETLPAMKASFPPFDEDKR
ncbi:MAG: glutathione S-transferase family protein [Rhizobiaceae bacterium]